MGFPFRIMLKCPWDFHFTVVSFYLNWDCYLTKCFRADWNSIWWWQDFIVNILQNVLVLVRFPYTQCFSVHGISVSYNVLVLGFLFYTMFKCWWNFHFRCFCADGFFFLHNVLCWSDSILHNLLCGWEILLVVTGFPFYTLFQYWLDFHFTQWFRADGISISQVSDYGFSILHNVLVLVEFPFTQCSSADESSSSHNVLVLVAFPFTQCSSADEISIKHNVLVLTGCLFSTMF